MERINKIYSIDVFVMICVFFLCSFLTCNIALSRNTWNRDFTKIAYDPTDNTITFTFELIDYSFGPGNENGYLQWCDFSFTTDGKNYTNLMRAEVPDQEEDDWSSVLMKNKHIGTRIQFLACIQPENSALWPDNNDDVNVYVKHEELESNSVLKLLGFKFMVSNKAYLTIKWFIGDTFSDVKGIRLNGFWNVNGVYEGDKISNVDYTLQIRNNKNSNNSTGKLTAKSNHTVR